LKAKQDAYDQDVARLMDEDESIGKEIAAAETAITESATTIQELTARLETITEAQKANHGIAMVKVGGNVFSGTEITGPHSRLVLQEDLKKLSIIETDKPDHSGAKRWHFELNPFR
jgi:prefoldin subunit 5